MKYCLYIALLSIACSPYIVVAKTTTKVNVNVAKLAETSKDTDAMYEACDKAKCPKGQEFNGTTMRLSPNMASCECEKI